MTKASAGSSEQLQAQHQCAPPISDYAMVGNLRCCALISKAGSVDWFCPPKFDAPACFAALLGSPHHGRWSLGPQGKQVEISRRYLPDTLILETCFTTDAGVVKVLDFMPVDGHCHLIRVVRGVSGKVAMVSECSPRFAYGQERPEANQQRTIMFKHEQGNLILASDVDQHRLEQGAAHAQFEIKAGDQKYFVLSFTKEDRTARAPVVEDAEQACIDWWQEWVGRSDYQGPWRDTVIRSLITLKALTYEPTGAMVAAPTTSLPEIPGGEANWDYRYCWIRDAALVLDIFLRRNHRQEALAWLDWLLDVVYNPDSILHPVYALDGAEVPPEREIPGLPGYRSAKPVRTGNGARSQFQIDLRGELLDVFHLARKSGLESADCVWDLQCRLLKHLDDSWHKPDAGIWEFREDGLQLTHSKVLAWVAYDRSIKDAERFDLAGPVEHWRRIRKDIRAEILAKGVHPERQYFTQSYGSNETDASLLLIPELGFLPADDPRMLATVKKIEQDLCIDDLVYRYHTDEQREGAFLPCTFWLANNYMLVGRKEDARRVFEKAVALCNDVGLLAEEYDPHSHQFLGNFPQSFTHLELVNSAELIGAGEHVYRSGEE